ncbi:MAG: hypothetical protein SNJ82_05210 [Gemmataceae bacterium]
MGLEREVVFDGPVPPWSAVAAHLSNVQMRMINGNLAAPDELPEEPWQELRVAREGEMITLRRLPDRVVLVGWANPTPARQQLTEDLVRAFTAASQS